jgi:acid phosphatase
MDVARAMDQYSSALTPRPSFVVALGDNFYTDGVQSSTDSLWDSLWKDVYLGFETLNIPWYPVFGNHDYGYGSKGVQAQIDRSREHVDDDTWRLEATNYTKTFDISEQGGTVHIV